MKSLDPKNFFSGKVSEKIGVVVVTPEDLASLCYEAFAWNCVYSKSSPEYANNRKAFIRSLAHESLDEALTALETTLGNRSPS